MFTSSVHPLHLKWFAIPLSIEKLILYIYNCFKSSDAECIRLIAMMMVSLPFQHEEEVLIFPWNYDACSSPLWRVERFKCMMSRSTYLVCFSHKDLSAWCRVACISCVFHTIKWQYNYLRHYDAWSISWWSEERFKCMMSCSTYLHTIMMNDLHHDGARKDLSAWCRVVCILYVFTQ